MGFLDTYVKIKQTADLGNARAELENIRHQNAHFLQQAEMQNAQMNALRNQISAANEVNRQILENQFKEVARVEKQRFYKDYLFLISRVLPEIKTLPNGPIRYDIFEKLRPILQTNAEIAMEELDEIHDKTAAQKALSEIEKMCKNLDKDRVAHSKSLLNGFNEIKADYLRLKDDTRPQEPQKKLIPLDSSERQALSHSKKKNTTPGTLTYIGVAVLVLGIVVFIIPGFLATLGSLGCIGSGLFIIFSAAPKLRQALAKEKKNQERETAFQAKLVEHKSAMEAWQLSLSEHEYETTEATIRIEFPEYFASLEKIEAMTQAFASRWNLGNDTNDD